MDDASAARELEGLPIELPRGLEIVWLGVSGYRLTYEGVSIFIDPYLSRVPLRSFLLRRRALPDPEMIERYATAPGEWPGSSWVTPTSITPLTRRSSPGASTPRRTGRPRSPT